MGKMEAVAQALCCSIQVHPCWPWGLGSPSSECRNGHPKGLNLGSGLHPLFPDLPDLPSTFLENQKFHSRRSLLSKTPVALTSPASFPCLVAAAQRS